MDKMKNQEDEQDTEEKNQDKKKNTLILSILTVKRIEKRIITRKQEKTKVIFKKVNTLVKEV